MIYIVIHKQKQFITANSFRSGLELHIVNTSLRRWFTCFIKCLTILFIINAASTRRAPCLDFNEIQMGIQYYDFCRNYQNFLMEESTLNILCQCSALEETRLKYMSHRYLYCLSEISSVNIEDLNSFVSNCGWKGSSSEES